MNSREKAEQQGVVRAAARAGKAAGGGMSLSHVHYRLKAEKGGNFNAIPFSGMVRKASIITRPCVAIMRLISTLDT